MRYLVLVFILKILYKFLKNKETYKIVGFLSTDGLKLILK